MNKEITKCCLFCFGPNVLKSISYSSVSSFVMVASMDGTLKG